MKLKNLFLVCLTSIIILSGCETGNEVDTAHNLAENVKSRLIPDSRVDLFEVSAVKENAAIVLKGETTVPEAKSALLDSLNARGISYTDRIMVLPDTSLGEEVFGLVNNSVSNIRDDSRHSAQLTTQALLGMPVQVLKKDGGWYYIRTPDDYLSWIDSGGIERMKREQLQSWKDADKVIYRETYGFSFISPSRSAEKVSDLTAGNLLLLKGERGSWYHVQYPDGRQAYIPKSEASPFNNWMAAISPDPESLVKTAKTMMGIPYLWGGTSTKGMDCSGFTKTIYFMNGKVLPRDASQQVFAGQKVDDAANWDNLQPGDLLFFGREATDWSPRRVVHTGMWIGDRQFIHASRQIRISSVDSTAANFDAYNTGRYLESRRYTDNNAGNIIAASDMYDEILGGN